MIIKKKKEEEKCGLNQYVMVTATFENDQRNNTKINVSFVTLNLPLSIKYTWQKIYTFTYKAESLRTSPLEIRDINHVVVVEGLFPTIMPADFQTAHLTPTHII